jgi:hypothetical protein
MALDELFETPEFHDVQLGVDDVIVVIQVHRDLAVTLDTGHGIDNQFSAHDITSVYQS